MIFQSFAILVAWALGAQAQASCATGELNVVLTLIFDQYPEETSWEIVSAQSPGIVASKQDYHLTMTNPSTWTAPEIRVEQMCLDASETYTLTVSDDYGDGMCCDFSLGVLQAPYGPPTEGYTLEVDGAVVATGGEFDLSEAVEFGCQDDPTWFKILSSGVVKHCDPWAGQWPSKRCPKVGQDGRPASEACPVSCGNC